MYFRSSLATTVTLVNANDNNESTQVDTSLFTIPFHTSQPFCWSKQSWENGIGEVPINGSLRLSLNSGTDDNTLSLTTTVKQGGNGYNDDYYDAPSDGKLLLLMSRRLN